MKRARSGARRGRRPRIFMGYIDICGIYRTYERTLRQAGYQVTFVNLGVEHYKGPTPLPWPANFYRWAARRGAAGSTSAVGDRFLLYFSILLMLAWQALCFDLFLFKSGKGMSSSQADIRILRKLGKTIIFTYHGSDSRPSYLTPSTDGAAADSTREKADFLAATRGMANFVIDSPTSAHLQRQRCLLRQVYFNPLPLWRRAEPDPPGFVSRFQGNGVRILHCPSDPALKGSDIIRAGIQSLVQEGFAIDYVEIVGAPNEEVLAHIKLADIAVDEMFSDNYGGVFATECVTVGTPVIVGGYALEALNRAVPVKYRLPTIYTHPGAFLETLRSLLAEPKRLHGLSEQMAVYRDEVFSPGHLSERLTDLWRQEPVGWSFFEPDNIDYFDGAAAKRERVAANIRAVIEQHGEDALCLSATQRDALARKNAVADT